ncbi:MAG: hypothetical protein EXR54_05945 [Dehalococcoidia bacterium]|nr:hypothetical protein [Dehalococcoidia bacterium]MSQ17098.1 hypothetical protein [Dehalococcoidia bacterium]
MSKLLQDAFAKLAKLPDRDQDSIAEWLLEELASEQLWDKLFAGSSGEMERLADAALSEYSQGRTQELDPNKL